MEKRYLFMADGFEEIEGLTVVDLLRRAQMEIITVSVSDCLEVTGAHGIKVFADVRFQDTDFTDGELFVLPGGMPGTTNLGNHQGLCELLEEMNKKGKKLAAICAAPSVFGKLGLLKGKKAVCYPGFEEQLLGATVLKKPVVSDGTITTGRGMGCAIEFALELISGEQGKEAAAKIAEGILYA